MFLIFSGLSAQAAAGHDPLFSSHELIEVTISGPLRTLMDERPTEEDLPGKLSYLDHGERVEIDIGLRTRGRYRRQERICPFAPVRLNIKKSSAKGTLFAKQDKLKLVAHCRNSSERYQQVTLKEYLAYRFLNELTDLSFRVRMLRITYHDTEDPDDELVRYGFLIEHRDRMSKRIDLPHVEVKGTGVSALDAEYTNLISVFQYFIANTDFSPIAGAPDDFCCHNSVLFGNEGESWISVPYDFDMAGMTDAPYATPNAKFKIRNVRQRLYRGRCQNNEQLPATIRKFQEEKADFYALVRDMDELSGSSEKSMIAMIDRFYKLIDDPRAVDKYLARKCI